MTLCLYKENRKVLTARETAELTTERVTTLIQEGYRLVPEETK